MEDGPPAFQQDSPCPTVLRCSPHVAPRMPCTGLSPPAVALPRNVPLYVWFLTPRGLVHVLQHSLTTPAPQRCTPITECGFGLFPLRSPLLRESLARFLLLQVLRWFSSLGLASVAYVFNYECAGFYPHGLPHSVIPGSQDVCSSPGLFAAYHDLLRQTAP